MKLLIRGVATLIDRRDLGLIRNKPTHIGNGYVYVFLGERKEALHRLIMSPGKNFVIDHKNHDTLDNRRKNLRICTKMQNSQNLLRAWKKNRTGFKGVYACHTYDGFYAQINMNGKRTHVGSFKSKVEAARAYNLAALKEYGEFAQLNKI